MASLDTGAHATVAQPNAMLGGFAASDLSWERCQEQAALAFQAGDSCTCARLWGQALEIADQHFSRGDPRLATSLTNQALVMRRTRHDYQAKVLFDRALQVWDDSWRWVALMTPATPPLEHARASDRLEIYDRAARTDFDALIARGRAATATLERYDELTRDRLNQWFEIKPRRMSDLRKLLAAVLLLAPSAHG